MSDPEVTAPLLRLLTGSNRLAKTLRTNAQPRTSGSRFAFGLLVLKDATVGSTARGIGEDLQRAMKRRGVTERELAEMTKKDLRHLKAVLNGYPNAKRRPIEIDTVDEIANALHLKLELTAAE